MSVEPASLRADLAHDGMLWATLYQKGNRWYSGHVVARSEQEAIAKLQPGEKLDGQVIGEDDDDGAAQAVLNANMHSLCPT